MRAEFFCRLNAILSED